VSTRRLFGTILRRYVGWVTLHPRSIIAIILTASALLSVKIPSIYIENERKLNLPGNNPIVQLDDEILKMFGGGKFTMIGVVPREGDIFQPWFLEILNNITPNEQFRQPRV